MTTVFNPLSGRRVEVGGRVYNKLVSNGVIAGDNQRVINQLTNRAIKIGGRAYERLIKSDDIRNRDDASTIASPQTGSRAHTCRRVMNDARGERDIAVQLADRALDQLYLGTLISFNIMLISMRGELVNYYNFKTNLYNNSLYVLVN